MQLKYLYSNTQYRQTVKECNKIKQIDNVLPKLLNHEERLKWRQSFFYDLMQAWLSHFLNKCFKCNF